MLASILAVLGTLSPFLQAPGDRAGAAPAELPPCLAPHEWLAAYGTALAGKDLGSNGDARAPEVAPRAPRATGGATPELTTAHVFWFEDTAMVLKSNYSPAELGQLMVDGANALMAVHGDDYDFVGFFLNFQPAVQPALAGYFPIQNDVLGIGDPSGMGFPVFNKGQTAPTLAGENVQGMVMMFDVSGWIPGATLTRHVVAHEFEHRYAVYLPNLLDGRRMVGSNPNFANPCRNGTTHWNRRIDGQGSAMWMPDWDDANPAYRMSLKGAFNVDTGGLYSYTDLYLMGMVSPAEMDAGNGALRYMDGVKCEPVHAGPISHFSSADIIAAAGIRDPGHGTAQKDFRAGWIMIHLPGKPPQQGELERAVEIMARQQVDFRESTLERGTWDNRLFEDCNGNDVSDAIDIETGTSRDENGNGIPDECEGRAASRCAGTVDSLGCEPRIELAGVASASGGAFEVGATGVPRGRRGAFAYGLGGTRSAPFAGGALCVRPPVRRAGLADSGGRSDADPCAGRLALDFGARLRSGADPELLPGVRVHGRWWYRDPGSRAGVGLTDGVSFHVGP